MSVRNRPKHSDSLQAKRQADERRDRAAPVVSFRATRMSRERTCPVAHTAKGFALLRQKDYSAFSRMAARHRPEVAVTIGQNVASAKSTRHYLDVRQEPPEAQRLRRDRAAPVVSFRATRMSRERTCPAAHTAKGLALHQLFCSEFSRMADRHRAEVVVTAAQNSATAK